MKQLLNASGAAVRRLSKPELHGDALAMRLPFDLPNTLDERVRPVNSRPASGAGEFILYWMHHAVRGHENPALEVALHAGNVLRLPVLVYQGLGGCHRYHSDRHHTFIMEGAREAQAALQARGIAYAFHLARDPSARSPLRSLAERAALVIAEDFPAPPFPRWTRRVAQSVASPLWAVDCQCIVPMRLVGHAHRRAFEFRRATAAHFAERLDTVWQETPYEGSNASLALGFAPLDLQHADIAALCAECAIDHGVGPVRHTQGGARAGYERWEAFRQQGLKIYHRLRNDAASPRPKGVSGLSPYLHHGHVSPFRIAREADREGGEGATKFLDELFTWRELAHNFCFHTEGLESMAALPGWAQETLAVHRTDPRPRRYSWEALARAQTGDALWDAAQKSLLAHGELHNNVRMTWGKAFLQWTDSPGEALQLMIDLNHRYALDGNDPNSYGGLLYCLGLFDRPFRPERAIYGTVRPRPTAQHARRLDLSAYQAHIARPPRSQRLRVAVVGAGMSGLNAARLLADGGHEVMVLDKGRGAGGRMATRRHGDAAFDHGAQYFTVRDGRFHRYVQSWWQDGIVAPWDGRVVVAEAGRFETLNAEVTRYVGVPSMSALPHHLARSLKVCYGTQVTQLRPLGRMWRLVIQGGVDAGLFDAVILALPAPQAAELLAPPVPTLAERVQAVAFAPCWATMVTFEQPLSLVIDGAFVKHADLAWIARNASKPGRPPSESWVLHATAEWSAAHIEDAPGRVAEALCAVFLETTGALPAKTCHLESHRWRYAKAQEPLAKGCLWDADARLAVCGDWCYGSRVEGAFLSGMAAAGSVLGLPDMPELPDILQRA